MSGRWENVGLKCFGRRRASPAIDPNKQPIAQIFEVFPALTPKMFCG
jgi:hypothetical protein